ncbi:hypothetical protein B0H10DRAFT_2009117 [Mycena sp. CBHHK59/15]|nr:hypothetical protein B0H10DRAFT_2009117 [Mycena sp. CBHHK59/15]
MVTAASDTISVFSSDVVYGTQPLFMDNVETTRWQMGFDSPRLNFGSILFNSDVVYGTRVLSITPHS